MATPRRIWDRLSAETRNRYVARGRSLGQSEAQVRAHYESGGNMSVYRGHPSHHGVSEGMWRRLRKAAKAAGLDQDLEHGDVNIVLSSLLAKGFSPQWILGVLDEKSDSRSVYRSRAARQLRKLFPREDWGWDPGRTRWHRRNLMADIEVYYYH